MSPGNIHQNQTGHGGTGEFEEILKVFNQFPVKELIIHPRTRKDQYKGALHPEWFAYAAETSRISLCFNGDIETKEQYEQIQKKYPRANIMIGRGFLKKPGTGTGDTAGRASG